MSGTLVLMGSGEISPSMVATHRVALGDTPTVTTLDTPYGFQENADVLTARISAYFRTSLSTNVDEVSLRNSTVPELDRLRAIAAIGRADYLFTGPGSPTYALGVWRTTGTADAIRNVLAAGSTVVLASAAALTAGTHTIPVYEIYKVGVAPHWVEGLDLTSQLGVPMVVVPHWDNREGGNHDTSRCYMGERRLRLLEAELDVGILGIDEHTAATVDFSRRRLEVSGKGAVTLRGAETRTLAAGSAVALDIVAEALGKTREAPKPPVMSSVMSSSDTVSFSDTLAQGDVENALEIIFDRLPRDEVLRAMVLELGETARRGVVDPRDRVAGFVDLVLGLRSEARSAGQFDRSDQIRESLADLGVEVSDTEHGALWDLAASPD